ncbi:hypothetical protein DVH02_14880 [Streptomyces corynorhini]|uniref:Uncharacterized protein n=1 Tax=Streptomyces corynorhini TaxID=2282652 RepID=A0A370B6A5_9ACTN|nr:hypothetical protein DVH02_14880 [Streptomyces corynorhini]
MAIGDLDSDQSLYRDIDETDPGESELDEFSLSPSNEPHAHMSEELGRWILDRLPSWPRARGPTTADHG